MRGKSRMRRAVTCLAAMSIALSLVPAQAFAEAIDKAIEPAAADESGSAFGAEYVPEGEDAIVSEPEEEPSPITAAPETEPKPIEAAGEEAASVSSKLSAAGDNIASGTWGTCPWEISAAGVLTVHPGVGKDTRWPGPWDAWANDIVSVVLAREGKNSVVMPSDCGYLFCGLAKAKTMDLSGADTSAVTGMASMFDGCRSLTSLNLSGWDTSKVSYMDNMFYDCSSLTSLDLRNWDTTAVTGMASMFYGCGRLTSLNLSGWNTSAVTDMSSMFSACKSLVSLDLSGWDTSQVTSMSSMFAGCKSLATLKISGWDTPNVSYLDGMFGGCSSLTSLDLRSWDTSQATIMTEMFAGCESLVTLKLSGWNTSSVGDMAYMFQGCKSLRALDLSGWDTTSTDSTTDGVFSGCSSLKTVKLGKRFGLASMLPSSSEIRWVAKSNGKTYRASAIPAYVADTYDRTTLKEQTVTASNKKVAMGKTLALKARASAGGKLTYKSSNGKAIKVSKKGVVTPKRVGTWTIVVTAAETSTHKRATKKVIVTVTKGANPLVAKTSTKTVGAAVLKKKGVTVAPIAVSKAQGKVTYAKASGAKALSVSKKTGRITVAKGTKKGTYTAKVKVTAAGNANWKSATKTVTVKVIVR